MPDLSAQTENAAITGRITDPQGRIVPDVAVQVVNIDTNVAYQAKTNGNGIYAIPSVRPGRYRLALSKEGFKDIHKTGIELHVQDILEQNFALEVGSTSETVTVRGESANINTTGAAVSTVIDRNFANNLPLNGRSLQSLIYLTPGVTLNSGRVHLHMRPASLP